MIDYICIFFFFVEYGMEFFLLIFFVSYIHLSNINIKGVLFF